VDSETIGEFPFFLAQNLDLYESGLARLQVTTVRLERDPDRERRDVDGESSSPAPEVGERE
jgi:hypothetical protein